MWEKNLEKKYSIHKEILQLLNQNNIINQRTTRSLSKSSAIKNTIEYVQGTTDHESEAITEMTRNFEDMEMDLDLPLLHHHQTCQPACYTTCSGHPQPQKTQHIINPYKNTFKQSTV